MRKVINVLLAAAAVIVALNTINILRTPYQTEVARLSTVKKSVNATGIVVREERVLSQAGTGVLETNLSDGERVASGQYLGAVVSGAYDAVLANELEDINTRIESIKGTGGSGDIYAADSEHLDALLAERIRAVTSASAREDIKEAILLADQISVIMSRKSEGAAQSPAKKLLEELESRRAQITQSLGGTRQELYSPCAGVFESEVDGFENVATADSLSSLTPEGLEQMLGMDLSANAAGICKIVNNYEWYIAANIDEEMLTDVQVGSRVSLIFENAPSNRITAYITYISPASDGVCAVAVKSNRYVSGITSARQVSFEMLKATYSGIHVPASAVRVKDGETGVYILSDSREAFRTFREVYKCDEFYLVTEASNGTAESLAIYDEIILNPKEQQSGT
ncbi:MAG: HlyD family efflux transporter periplasmic adaptor subunit [Clostridia bacterium]|nr:HlyD family efflux transporter periplasmic adaptor subunit [Clostridia bacterium]